MAKTPQICGRKWTSKDSNEDESKEAHTFVFKLSKDKERLLKAARHKCHKGDPIILSENFLAEIIQDGRETIYSKHRKNKPAKKECYIQQNRPLKMKEK